jgi:hypothetical protein
VQKYEARERKRHGGACVEPLRPSRKPSRGNGCGLRNTPRERFIFQHSDIAFDEHLRGLLADRRLRAFGSEMEVRRYLAIFPTSAPGRPSQPCRRCCRCRGRKRASKR